MPVRTDVELAAGDPLDLINGLPVHPLVVHAAVVLIPLAALGVVLMALIPRFSRSVGWLVVAVAVAGAGAAKVAEEAGERFVQRVGEPGFDHQELGELMSWFGVALVVVSLVLWLLDRRKRPEGPAPRGGLGIGVAVLAVLVATANLVWVYRVGDSGARSVWAAEVAQSTPTPSPDVQPSPTPTATATPAPTSTAAPATFTLADVATHNSPADCWAAIDGAVYNLTAWVDQHPGGAERIVALCGTDATAAFSAQHSGDQEPMTRLPLFVIGALR